MDRLRTLLSRSGGARPPPREYEALPGDADEPDRRRRDEYHQGAPPSPPSSASSSLSSSSSSSTSSSSPPPPLFSRLEYGIFVLLGVAMLWAWNMFLAAAPYFQARFGSDPPLAAAFQPAILTVSTLTSLAVTLALQRMQQAASYPFRIGLALVLSAGVFVCLAASTVAAATVPARMYAAFVLAAVAGSSWAAGLIQNGAFAFAAGLGHGEYMQALMTGQAIAGVLPPAAELATVLLLSPPSPQPQGGGGGEGGDGDGGGEHGSVSGSAAFVYFLLAAVVSLTTLAVFWPVARNLGSSRPVHFDSDDGHDEDDDGDDDGDGGAVTETMSGISHAERAARGRVTTAIGTRRLLSQLWLHVASVIITFAASMSYPVLTVRIRSVLDADPSAPAITRPAAFIPLAFFFWNVGDLCGRVLTLVPALVPRRCPAVFLVASIGRIGFIPLYLLCNLDGGGGGRDGRWVASDAFYLLVVQLGFGITNGWICSCSMITAGERVHKAEREAAGSFMGLCVFVGLAVGSVLSFAVMG